MLLLRSLVPQRAYISKLDGTRFIKNNRLIQTGAGCTWDEVYKKTYSKRRIIVGDSNSQRVGVGGYLLGGGYSMKIIQY